MIESVLRDASLRQVNGAWALFYQGKEYIRLLDANSREEAEQQISEMLFLRLGRPPTQQEPEDTPRHRTSK